MLNIQSVRNKGNELYIFLEQHNLPNLVFLTEHWLRSEEPFECQNYVIASKYCRTQSQHGGTMILVNQNALRDLTLNNIEKFNHLIVEKEFEFSLIHDSKNNIFLICIYRTPTCNVTAFLNRMEILLSSLPVNSQLIVAGDLNINYDDKNSASTHALNTLFLSYDLKMSVKEPTRISQYSSTTIDYICTNMDEEKLTCNVIPAGLSDHEGVILEFPIKSNNSKKIFKFGRIYSSKNFNKFKQKSDQIAWEEVLSKSDSISAFQELLTGVFEECFPKRKLKIKNKKSWITQGIKISANNLRSLHSIRKYFSDEFLIAYFNKYRQIYRRVIKLAKEIHYKIRINKAGNKIKENWAIVNTIRGKSNSIPEQADIDPETLNNFYCTIAQKLTSSLAPTSDPIDYLSNLNISNNFHIKDTHLLEIKEILLEIKNKNATGIDEISVNILNNLPDSALNTLVMAINKSFALGKFPPSLKTAVVIPLCKGGDSEDPNNFRPISMLSTLSKIIEKVVKKRVLAFLYDNNLLTNCQFGFQKAKGTNDAIFSFLEHVYTYLNNGEVAAAVFCDFSKAFDCVNHELLMQKLDRYGFRGVCNDWFRSYISDRKQLVRSNEKLSHAKDILWGVPQGSVLGPILFLIYLNDLVTLSIQGVFTIFADDTTLLWHGKNSSHMEETISRDLEVVKKWCDANYLCFNIKKTNLLTFSSYIDNLNLNGHILENKSQAKFLGIFMDNNLKFDQHISALTKKLASGCYALRIVSNELSLSTTKMVYHSLIESHLRYGVAFWGFCSQQLFHSVFVLQKRAVRYLCKVGVRESCRPLFLREKILTLSCLFILETVCLIHKKQNMVGTQEHAHYKTRQVTDNKLQLPVPKTNQTKYSVIYESKKLYNHIPFEIRKEKSYKRFRTLVKEALTTKAYYNLEEYYNGTLQ